MDNDIIANATITMNIPGAYVWEALTKPEIIKHYLFGTNILPDWKEGSSIVWKGEWQGKRGYL